MARGTPAVRNRHGGRDSPEAGPGGIPACVGSDVGDGGLGEVPGAQARLLRRLGLAVGRRSSAGTAAQGLRAARLGERGGVRVWAAMGWDRSPGGCGVVYEGAPGSRRAHPNRKAGEITGPWIVPGRCAAGKGGGDGAGGWARAVSGARGALAGGIGRGAGCVAEREWRWRAGPGAQRAGDAREGGAGRCAARVERARASRPRGNGRRTGPSGQRGERAGPRWAVREGRKGETAWAGLGC
jgi:hypothetical protein